MLEGVADSMASVILRNATSFGETDDAAGAGSEPGISKAAFLILVFEAFRAHPAGYVGFLFFLTFWTTLAMPVTPLEICAGCVFGPYWGTAGSLVESPDCLTHSLCKSSTYTLGMLPVRKDNGVHMCALCWEIHGGFPLSCSCASAPRSPDMGCAAARESLKDGRCHRQWNSILDC
eukprot:680545-Rhodomonas_salina.1